MEELKILGTYAGAICQIVTCAMLLVRPIREWLMGTEEVREGQRCLLRSEILRIYYRNLGSRRLQEYEYQNLEKCFDAYKALRGNSFIDRIYEQMKEWEVG